MSVHALRDFLVDKTIAYAAANTTFYPRFWNGAEAGVHTVADLVRLPVLEKQVAVAHQEEMRVGPPMLEFGSISSGTTRVGNEVFRVERSIEEAEALADLLERRQRRAQERAHRPAAQDEDAPTGRSDHEDAEAGEGEPLVLHILTPNHGLPSGAPPENTLRLAWSYSHNVNRMVEAALARDYGGQQIEVLRCSVSILKQLTVYFLEHDVDFSKFGVIAIGTNAALVTSRWRRLVENLWGARIYDNYSLSEFITPATECYVCGHYHFGAPPVVPEVLDLKTGLPISEGTGHLVMTGLFPFVQRQPLIRYATGDIVSLGPPCETTEDIGLRFVGRRHQCLLWERDHATEVLLSPAVVEDVTDGFVFVSRHPHPFELTAKIPPGRVGQPRYRLSRKGPAILVEFGLDADPRLFPADTARGERLVRDALLARSPRLQAALEEEAVQLTVRAVAARADDWGEWFVKYLL